MRSGKELIFSLAAIVGQCTILKRILRIPYHFFGVKPYARRYRKKFHKYGLEVLKIFTDCLETNGYPYVLFAGSMLGAIREHGFIKHDMDIDVAMWIDSYDPQMINELSQVGFSLLFNIEIDEGKLGKEFTFYHRKTGLKVDIFFFYPAVDKLPYHCDFVITDGMRRHERLPRRLEYPMTKKRRKERFENLDLWVPQNAEELCKFRYGASFMTPNPQWNWMQEKNNVVEWPEMIPKTVHITYHVR